MSSYLDYFNWQRTSKPKSIADNEKSSFSTTETLVADLDLSKYALDH